MDNNTCTHCGTVDLVAFRCPECGHLELFAAEEV